MIQSKFKLLVRDLQRILLKDYRLCVRLVSSARSGASDASRIERIAWVHEKCRSMSIPKILAALRTGFETVSGAKSIDEAAIEHRLITRR